MLEQSPQKCGEEILELILLAKDPGLLKCATGGERLERLNEAVRAGTLQELPDGPGPTFDQRPTRIFCLHRGSRKGSFETPRLGRSVVRISFASL